MVWNRKHETFWIPKKIKQRLDVFQYQLMPFRGSFFLERTNLFLDIINGRIFRGQTQTFQGTNLIRPKGVGKAQEATFSHPHQRVVYYSIDSHLLSKKQCHKEPFMVLVKMLNFFYKGGFISSLLNYGGSWLNTT